MHTVNLIVMDFYLLVIANVMKTTKCNQTEFVVDKIYFCEFIMEQSYISKYSSNSNFSSKDNAI